MADRIDYDRGDTRPLLADISEKATWLVLRALSGQGPLTQPELAEATGLHRTQVGRIVEPLRRAKLVVSDGGRPARYSSAQRELLLALVLAGDQLADALAHQRLEDQQAAARQTVKDSLEVLRPDRSGEEPNSESQRSG